MHILVFLIIILLFDNLTFNFDSMNKKLLLLTTLLVLTIFSCKKEEEPSTSLELTITDILGNIVPNAVVLLYSSLNDIQNGTNEISYKLTNSDGKVSFDYLANIKYYWFVSTGCTNNSNGAITSTSPLTAHQKTSFNIVLSSIGTIKFINNSTNPYRIFINGVANYDMSGGSTTYRYNVLTGAYVIRVLQLSGYVFTPTDETFNGSVSCGNTLSISFP